jgi:hypothetical protein
VSVHGQVSHEASRSPTMTVTELIQTKDVTKSATHPSGTGALSPPRPHQSSEDIATGAATAMLSADEGEGSAAEDEVLGLVANSNPDDPINVEVMVADLQPQAQKWLQNRVVTAMPTLVMIASVCGYPAATTPSVRSLERSI